MEILLFNFSSKHVGYVCVILIPCGTCYFRYIHYAYHSFAKSKNISIFNMQNTFDRWYRVKLIENILQEYENKILPWLWSFAAFTILRSLAWLFFIIVNDLIFAYNIFICLFWALLIVSCIWSWLVVYSLYVELSDLSKLEDLAHLRVSYIKYFVMISDIKLNYLCAKYFFRWEPWHPYMLRQIHH